MASYCATRWRYLFKNCLLLIKEIHHQIVLMRLIWGFSGCLGICTHVPKVKLAAKTALVLKPRFTSTMSQPGKSLIAICQMTSTANKEENLASCRKLIEEASQLGARVVFLPEACDYVAENQLQSQELAEDLSGPLMKSYQNLANTNNVWLSIGGFHNKCKTSNKIFNSHVMINAAGEIVGQYNKTHLFDIEIPEKKIRLKESDCVQKGESITPPLETPVGKVGLGICYDLRFPEFSLSLAQMGAEILTYPSAFTVATGLAHWESLLRARAIETQCYVIAAAQTGSHNSKRSSYGHAMVIDPWGAVIAQCREGTSVALTTIDRDYLAKVRQDMPVFSHRRHDVYRQPMQVAQPLHLPDDEAVFAFGQVKIKGWSVFYRSRHSVAFVNRKCVVPGHILLMPTRLAVRIKELSHEEVADLFIAVQRVQKGMELFHQVSSSTISIQDGPDSGQTISHVHVHVLPRKPGDFQENDQIYDALHKHDKGSDIAWRDEQEMKQEAAALRQFFHSLSW